MGRNERGCDRGGKRDTDDREIRLDRFRTCRIVERVRFGRKLPRGTWRDGSAEEGRERIQRRRGDGRGDAGRVELVGVVALAADDVLDSGRSDDLVGVRCR